MTTPEGAPNSAGKQTLRPRAVFYTGECLERVDLVARRPLIGSAQKPNSLPRRGKPQRTAVGIHGAGPPAKRRKNTVVAWISKEL
ncbi:hypothetical protein PMIN02_001176 [Paraphaeosphaeria minitans]